MADIVLQYPDGDTATYILTPDQELTLGRDTASYGRIQLNSPNVSRNHARIWQGGDGVMYIEDLGSSNGTLVNGSSLAEGQHFVLSEGDEIRIKPFSLVIRSHVSSVPGRAESDEAGAEKPSGEQATDGSSGTKEATPPGLVDQGAGGQALPAKQPLGKGEPEDAPSDAEKDASGTMRRASPRPSPAQAKPAPKRPQSAAPSALLPRFVLITSLEGAPAGTELPAEKTPATIGRSDKCTIVLRHPTVSDFHARLQVQMGQWQIIDRASMNGSFVNGERIPANKAYDIEDGDVVHFGVVAAQFVPGEARTARAPQPVDGAAAAARVSPKVKWIVLAATVGVFLFLQLIWYAIHWSAESAYHRRRWQDTQRLVDKLPVIYLWWSSAQQLREYATTDVEKSALVKQIEEFPPIVRVEDIGKFAELFRKIPPHSALYPEARETVENRIGLYLGKVIAAVRSDLAPADADDGSAGLFARLPNVEERVGDLRDTLRKIDVRTNLGADQLKQFEKDLRRLQTKSQAAKTLSEVSAFCRKPFPSSLEDLHVGLSAADECVKRLDAPAFRSGAKALGYDGVYFSTRTRLQSRKEALQRSIHSHETGSRLLRKAFESGLSPDSRFDLLEEAAERFGNVDAAQVRRTADQDLDACRKMLLGFREAGQYYSNGEYGMMRQALDARLDVADQTLRDMVEAQKWAGVRVCSDARIWAEEYDRFRGVPSLAVELLTGLRSKHRQLEQHEQKAYMLPSQAEARSRGLALVAYFAADPETALRFAKASDAVAFTQLVAAFEKHEQALGHAQGAGSDLARLRHGVLKASVDEFRAAARKFHDLRAAREAFLAAEQKFFAVVDVRFRARPSPYAQDVGKRYGAADRAREDIHGQLLREAEKRIAALREDVRKNDDTVVDPSASQRVRWLECVRLYDKAARLMGTSELEPRLGEVIGFLVPLRTDRMDPSAREFWLTVLKEIRGFPELSTRLRNYVQNKVRDLQSG